MKKFFYMIIFLLISINIYAQSLKITNSGGWLESAFIEWTPVNGVDKYSVYYSGEGVINKKIDDQLIRSYGSYYRADILGLKAGKYSIKVIPIVSGKEGDATVVDNIDVKAHDRTGFAFVNGQVPGAYKADGTPKDGAVILYITEQTKNSISLDVTGASTNPCVGLETILEGFKKGKDTRPLIIRVIGQITDLSYMDKGDIVIENNNNNSSYITFEGVGEDATIDGWGIRIKNANNIEIRNIGIMNVNSSEGDNIGLQQNNQYIWVHNVDFFYGDAGSDADQAKGDGALDCKKSTYITFSYNHFWDSGKCNLLGLSENTTDGLYITYHHNWYDHSDSRHPRVRFYSAHVYNNYYDGNSKYGVGSTRGSSVFVEANYFRNCKFPMLISMQGSDVWDGTKNDYSDMPTFSKEDGGIIKAYNNYMIGENRFVAYGDESFINSTTDFDAYIATKRDQTVPSSVKSAYGSNTYNNFDTDNSIMYNYTPDSPEDAKTNVIKYAGRVNGGDFKWSFDNTVDDQSYDVNLELKKALTTYTTKLVAVGSDGGNVVIDTTLTTNPPVDTTSSNATPTDTTNTITGNIIHNFTISGINSNFFNIIGNLSTSKGTVNYESLTLTQCLKMETSTSISFTTDNVANITLIFNSTFNGKIKIDDINYSVTNGELTTTISDGTHKITKGDASNLYYIKIEYKTNKLNRYDTGINNIFKVYPNPMNIHSTIYYSLKDSNNYYLSIYKNSILLKKFDIKKFEGSIKLNSLPFFKEGVYTIILYKNNIELIRKYMYLPKQN